MSAPHPAPDAPEPAIDPAVARTERGLARLERLADKGLALAEAVKEDSSAESAEAFAKLSRAVRLTIALTARLQEAPRVRAAGAEPKPEAADPFAPLKTGKKARVRELLRDAIDRETPDPEDNDTLVDALEERLLCDEAYDHIENLPLRDIVERLCADLQLKPDWSRWTGEGWKPNPPFWRPLCSDFRKPSRRPILNDLTDPHLLE